jgi:hypothetical protein
MLEHVGRDLSVAAAAQVIQPRQLLIRRRGAEVNVARVQVVRGKGLGPDDIRDAQLGTEGPRAVVELADAELGGRAGQFRDAGQVDLTAPEFLALISVTAATICRSRIPGILRIAGSGVYCDCIMRAHESAT